MKNKSITTYVAKSAIVKQIAKTMGIKIFKKAVNAVRASIKHGPLSDATFKRYLGGYEGQVPASFFDTVMQAARNVNVDQVKKSLWAKTSVKISDATVVRTGNKTSRKNTSKK